MPEEQEKNVNTQGAEKQPRTRRDGYRPEHTQKLLSYAEQHQQGTAPLHITAAEAAKIIGASKISVYRWSGTHPEFLDALKACGYVTHKGYQDAYADKALEIDFQGKFPTSARIAQHFGVTRVTIDDWKAHDDFRAAIEQRQKEWYTSNPKNTPKQGKASEYLHYAQLLQNLAASSPTPLRMNIDAIAAHIEVHPNTVLALKCHPEFAAAMEACGCRISRDQGLYKNSYVQTVQTLDTGVRRITSEMLAKKFSVTRETIVHWKKARPEFKAAIDARNKAWREGRSTQTNEQPPESQAVETTSQGSVPDNKVTEPSFPAAEKKEKCKKPQSTANFAEKATPEKDAPDNHAIKNDTPQPELKTRQKKKWGSKYNSSYPERLQALAESSEFPLRMTQEEIADYLGIHQNTVCNWRQKYPEFAAAMEACGCRISRDQGLYKNSYVQTVQTLDIGDRRMTDKILAKVFDVARETIGHWKKEHPKFKAAIDARNKAWREGPSIPTDKQAECNGATDAQNKTKVPVHQAWKDSLDHLIKEDIRTHLAETIGDTAHTLDRSLERLVDQIKCNYDIEYHFDWTDKSPEQKAQAIDKAINTQQNSESRSFVENLHRASNAIRAR